VLCYAVILVLPETQNDAHQRADAHRDG